MLEDFFRYPFSIRIACKPNQNKAGWSIQADFFADIPDGLFLRNQEAKNSERSENELEYFTLPYAQHNVCI